MNGRSRWGRTVTAVCCAGAVGLAVAACGSSDTGGGGQEGGLELAGTAMDGSQPAHCEVFEDIGDGDEYSGAMWIDDDQHYRIEVVQYGSTAIMLRDGDLFYGWVDGDTEGRILSAADAPVDPAAELRIELERIDGDAELQEEADQMYRCTTVSSVADDLAVPADVQFSDESAEE